MNENGIANKRGHLTNKTFVCSTVHQCVARDGAGVTLLPRAPTLARTCPSPQSPFPLSSDQPGGWPRRHLSGVSHRSIWVLATMHQFSVGVPHVMTGEFCGCEAVPLVTEAVLPPPWGNLPPPPQVVGTATKNAWFFKKQQPKIKVQKMYRPYHACIRM